VREKRKPNGLKAEKEKKRTILAKMVSPAALY